jgi:hypothetical protein
MKQRQDYTLSALLKGGIAKKEGKLTGKMIIEEVEDPEKKVITEIASDNWETYSMDYTTYLLEDNTTAAESEEVAPKLKGYELIDDFIEKSESEAPLCLKPLKEEAEISVTPSEEVSAAEEEDDSCFTETLAKIYVKQQRYSKALEIIKKLSLKYPKKNAYFADQIRFLEKLIINANSK